MGPLDRLDHCIKQKLSLTPSLSLSPSLLLTRSTVTGGESAGKQRVTHSYICEQQFRLLHNSVYFSFVKSLNISCKCICCWFANCVCVAVCFAGQRTFHEILQRSILRLCLNNESSLTAPPISFQP